MMNLQRNIMPLLLLWL